MKVMDEYGFVAHALRDYLRPFVDESALKVIDSPLNCGEPIEAIDTCIAVAGTFGVSLPPVYVRHILQLPNVPDSYLETFVQGLSQLPKWSLVA